MPRDCLSLPNALSSLGEIRQALAGRRPAVFLDYDGTLTPIVARPENAVLGEDVRGALVELAAVCPLAVVSGRALEDIRARVGIHGICYAGNHGFEIDGPGDPPRQLRLGGEFRPSLDSAHRALSASVEPIDGVIVEDKGYSLTVHSRQVAAHAVEHLEVAVDRVVDDHPRLAKHAGKRVHELRPALAWHKGHAVNWLLERMSADGQDLVPIFIGDDVTDEDAFEAIGDTGISVVVCAERKPTVADFRLEDFRQVCRLLRGVASIAGATP